MWSVFVEAMAYCMWCRHIEVSLCERLVIIHSQLIGVVW